MTMEAYLRVYVLGSSSGFTSATRDTMGLVVESGEGCTLVDCPGGVVHKMARAGLSAADLRRVVLTHNHVDHIYGVPHLLHALAIGADRETLTVHAPEQSLETVRAVMTAHDLWRPRFPRVDLQPIEMHADAVVAEAAGLRITASPAAHSRDTVALRFQADGIAACHSSDTRYSEAVAALAVDADLLLHDCAGLHRDRSEFDHNHSSALEAGQIASAAGVGKLVLIHLSAAVDEHARELVAEAAGAFAGEVVLARDEDVYEVSGTVRLRSPGRQVR
jgi:ribonuclease Z